MAGVSCLASSARTMGGGLSSDGKRNAMTPELKERLAKAADDKIEATITWPEDTEAVVSYSPHEIIDAILSELTAAGYAVVETQTISAWASRYDEVLRFSKWYAPRPGSVFNDKRAEIYRNTLGEMRNAAAMLKASEDQT